MDKGYMMIKRKVTHTKNHTDGVYINALMQGCVVVTSFQVWEQLP